MRDVFVVGAFVTPFGKSMERPMRALAGGRRPWCARRRRRVRGRRRGGVLRQLREGAPNDQHTIRGQVALQETGLLGAPIVNVENACASGSTAFHLARVAVAAGEADVALAVGAEKLTHPDKARSFAVFGSGWDVDRFGHPDPNATQSAFMDVYAAMAEDYEKRSGATREDFAAVSVKSHRHGALNPNAQYRDPLTVADVLASRDISGPLSLLMCSPVGDGAAALLLASREGLGRLGAAPEVLVRGTVLRSGTRLQMDGGGGAVANAAQSAYELTGVGPGDLDVVEVHDAAAPGELIVYEDLGLGSGPELIRTGATTLWGRIPVNPSGGLLSRGHPIGATGCAQLVELTDQLRGRCGARQVAGARVALAENGGGWIGGEVAAVVISILGR